MRLVELAVQRIYPLFKRQLVEPPSNSDVRRKCTPTAGKYAELHLETVFWVFQSFNLKVLVVEWTVVSRRPIWERQLAFLLCNWSLKLMESASTAARWWSTCWVWRCRSSLGLCRRSLSIRFKRILFRRRLRRQPPPPLFDLVHSIIDSDIPSLCII